MNPQDIVLSEDEQIELSRRKRSATLTIIQANGACDFFLLVAQGCSHNEITHPILRLSFQSFDNVYYSTPFIAWIL